MSQRYITYNVTKDITILEDLEKDEYFLLANQGWEPMDKEEGYRLTMTATPDESLINQENVTKLIIASISHDDDCAYPISRRTLVAILDRIWLLKPEWHEALDYDYETGWLIAAYDDIVYKPADDYYPRTMVEFKGKFEWLSVSIDDRLFIERTAWTVRNEQSQLTDNPEYKAAAYELRDKIVEVHPSNWHVSIAQRHEFETDDSWGVEWMTHHNGQDCSYSVDWNSWGEVWTYKAWRGDNFQSIHHAWKITDDIPDLFELMYVNNGNNIQTNNEMREAAGLPRWMELDK